MQKLIFYNGIIKNQVLNVILAEHLQIIDSNCSVSNSTAEKRQNIYTSVGGCFRTQNIFFREFININIFDSFSDQTTFGIKIIDDMSFFTNFQLSPYIPKVY